MKTEYNRSHSDILFIGGMFPKDKEREIFKNSKALPQIASNKLQWNLIEGLEINLQKPIQVISAMFLGDYPNGYKKILINDDAFNHTEYEEHKDFCVGFLNLPIVKHVFRKFSIYKCIKNNINTNCLNTVFGYSMSSPIVDNLLKLKKINPELKTCLIVPDLPEFMRLGAKKISFASILKWIDCKRLYKKIENIDYFVTVTEYMPERLGVPKDRCVVVEGIINAKNEALSREKTDKKIVYTGSLSNGVGIPALIDAFMNIPDRDAQLILAGSGNLTGYVEQAACRDKRIQYFGSVTSSQAKKLQEEAFLLVNPRNPKDEYTRYSFPSKLLEYMISGTPVLTFPLKGIPKEYKEYLILANNDLEAALKAALKADKAQLKEIGRSAQSFILNRNNPQKMTEKIIKLIFK